MRRRSFLSIFQSTTFWRASWSKSQHYYCLEMQMQSSLYSILLVSFTDSLLIIIRLQSWSLCLCGCYVWLRWYVLIICFLICILISTCDWKLTRRMEGINNFFPSLSFASLVLHIDIPSLFLQSCASVPEICQQRVLFSRPRAIHRNDFSILPWLLKFLSGDHIINLIVLTFLIIRVKMGFFFLIVMDVGNFHYWYDDLILQIHNTPESRPISAYPYIS